jgi:hypothetical protein
MDTIPAMMLIFGAAFAWLGLTVFVLLRLRRRRHGSSLVASAASPDSKDRRHGHRPWRRIRRATDRTSANGRKLSVRRVRG